MTISHVSNQNKCSITETLKSVCSKPAALCTAICLGALSLAHHSSETPDWSYTALVGIGTAAAVYVASRLLCRKPSPVPASLSLSASQPPEPTTTGYLRWMNIWIDAEKRGLLGANKNIIILGPGQKQYGAVFHCPLMAEAMKLCDGSSFTVLDSNHNVLGGVASIDPALAQKYIDETLNLNDTMSPANRRSLLGRVVERLKSPKAPECRLNLHPFRMGSDHLPKQGPEADFIHATFSLFYPLKELAASGTDPDSSKRFQLLGEYLQPLRKEGVLYVEQDTLTALLASPEYVRNIHHAPARMDQKTIGLIRERIEKETGIRVRIERLEQSFGEETIQGNYLVLQPDNFATQTTHAFALIRE